MIIEQDIDWKSRHVSYKDGKKPNFKNPVPGHLPVTTNLVQGVAIPQFSKVCK